MVLGVNMRYLKTLLFYFLIVFFVNYLFPGVDVVNQTKIPHIGGDLIFAVALGLLNSLIFPLLKMMDGPVGLVRISIVAFVLNFAAYGLLKMLPLGIFITNVEGYLAASLVVSIGSILISYCQSRHCRKCATHHHEEPPHHN
jgi:uncharacterized membrane protein YvlD (DUF360 family)